MMGQSAATDVLHGNFENSTPGDNPWSGVSSANVLAVRPGSQPAVNNEGKVTDTAFGPSVAVGDLNGDGLPDLVVGDAHGFIWFFPNSGTPTEPKFTHGEIMPIWFGATSDAPDYDITAGGAENSVPRVQLISLGGSKLLDLVVGNYNGRLFYVPNTGSPTVPMFKITPTHLHERLIKTRKDGLLWCNFLCPYLYDWWGTGNLDLILGDGSYSANSIFLLKNLGSSNDPIFAQESTSKIIPGMGREHLTPQVVDWNNDGKPDIIAGERTGQITVYLNTSADPKQPVPSFDDGHPVKLGNSDTFGTLPTVTVCDLTGNKLPNLILTNNHGTIAYAQNTGTLGAPQFGNPVPIAGTYELPKILRPIGWSLFSPYGVPNELLVCTNATVQPDFTPPPDTPFKNALRYYVYPIVNKYFPDFYYPTSDSLFDNSHSIRSSGFATKDNTAYHVSFWIKTSGNITDLNYHLWGWRTESGEDSEYFSTKHDVGNSSSWTHFEDTIRYSFSSKTKPNTEHESAYGFFDIGFKGQGEVYLDDILIQAD